jgi:hypothetical protein
MPEEKLVDEVHKISDRKGNGQLRREIWIDVVTRKVSRYNLAYINYLICSRDNGRVVGYDNAHDGHHRHVMGRIEPVEFVSFEDIESRFESDWLALREHK